MNNKRNINRFDPFIPINMSSFGKTKLSDSRSMNIANDFVTDNSFGFINIDDTFKVEMPCVKKGFVVVFSKKEIGNSNGLGEKLLEDFISSLSDMIELPQYVIIMNEGVYLLDNKNIYENIIKMQKYGVKFLISIESVKYFNYVSSLKGVKQATSADITEKIIFSEKLINM